MKKNGGSLSQVRVIYVLTTVFLLILSIYTFIQIRNLIDSSDLVNRTSEVNQILQKIASLIFEAETNKRGFLLSRDSLMFQKRELALNSLNVQQRLLDSLIKDNPAQIKNLKKLQIIINEKIISIRSIGYEKDSLVINANLKTNIIKGSERMDRVKRHIDYMTKTETNLLKIHTQKYNWYSTIMPLYIIALFIGAILILLVSYFRINDELHQSQKLQKELAFQNEEKEKRAEELNIANIELAFQNKEKEKRAEELSIANKELQLFAQISSHDLQEPLRKLQMAASRIAEQDYNTMSDKGKEYFKRMQDAALSMQTLIDDLIEYSRANNEERKFENIDLNIIITEAINGLKERIDEKHALIEVAELCEANIIPFQFRQILHNLIGNAIKFSKPNVPPHIIIKSKIANGVELNNPKLLPQEKYCHITITDNGIGFEPQYSEKIFEVFQRLHGKTTYKGTGIGLAIVKKIVENHKGIITATSNLNQGATFDIYIPAN